MRGEHATSSPPTRTGLGSPPPVRGAREFGFLLCYTLGITPACAGSTIAVMYQSVGSRDHPRLCGEHESRHSQSKSLSGSPPPVRGAPVSCTAQPVNRGITPACAGSTASSYKTLNGIRGSPPPVRGAHPVDPRPALVIRITPACAGSTVIMIPPIAVL